MNKVQGSKVWAWLIGVGLILFAIHNPNQPLLEYAFLPVIGLTISLLACLMVITDNRKNLDFGPKWLWIPLVIIATSIALSGIINGETVGSKFAPLAFGTYLIGIYLSARILGEDLFAPFAFAVIIEAVSCVVIGIVDPGVRNGGIVSPWNYDMAAGLLVIGVLVSTVRHQWWLSAVALVGLFFTGAEEGWFAVGIITIILLIRKDWNKKLLIPALALAITIAICTPLGITQGIYGLTAHRVDAASSAVSTPDTEEREQLLEEATGYRWLTHWRISPIKPFGYGYTITEFYEGIPHMMPLVITEQVGPVAMLAWLFILVLCLIKSRWKYAWLGIGALSVFDHYLWTQVAPWFWALAGASTVSYRNDLIFRRSP